MGCFSGIKDNQRTWYSHIGTYTWPTGILFGHLQQLIYHIIDWVADSVCVPSFARYFGGWSIPGTGGSPIWLNPG